ncbi:MAG: NACHT domain-containing protein, partial [Gammaproteobacteria bacterium]|nr:NACHT domain-containing protein [Gammaproteobacteria bacterium]
RLGEYTALPARLRLHGAIRLNALTREQVDGYLATQGGDLAGLRAALAEDESLAALARSPLMLSVMSVAYRGRRI